MLGSVPNSANMLGRYLLNSANAGQMPAEISECWAEEVENILQKRSLLVTCMLNSANMLGITC